VSLVCETAGHLDTINICFKRYLLQVWFHDSLLIVNFVFYMTLKPLLCISPPYNFSVYLNSLRHPVPDQRAKRFNDNEPKVYFPRKFEPQKHKCKDSTISSKMIDN